MTRYALIAALSAAVGLAGWLVVVREQNAALRAENASLTRSIAALELSRDQARLARQVEAARAERERDRADEASATIEAILTADLGECADAQLDPDLADLLRGVRPAD